MKTLTTSYAIKKIQYAKPISSNLSLVARYRPWNRGQSFWVCHQCLHTATSISQQSEQERSRVTSRNRSSKFRLSFTSSARRTLHSSRQPLEKQSRNDAGEHKDLPSAQEGRRSHLSRRFSDLMDHAQSNIFIAGQRLNDLTGYSGIEALKKDIERQEQLVQTTKENLQEAKNSYAQAISQRSASQREVNELLQRKHAWSPQDLERFTSLYRSDHANEQTEASAQEAVAMAERASEEATSKLGASILARYHEEQIWSDKIRRMSTWGTWGLMGVNVFLFLIFQIGVEPWRRKRLVKGFEEKVLEALEREGAAGSAAAMAAHQVVTEPQHEAVPEKEEPVVEALYTMSETESAIENVVSEEVQGQFQQQTPVTDNGSIPQATPSWKSIVQDYKERVHDLFSERQVTTRRVDITATAMEGLFAGFAIAGIAAAIVRAR